MEYSPKKMENFLKERNFNFKKNFGQNFIVDKNIIDNIIRLSLVDKDTMVIEIGPGAGSLTTALASSSKNVLCYEIDDSLKYVLSDSLNNYDNVDIIYQDFLKANVNEELKKYTYNKLYVIANLPYYITTPIITKIIENKLNVDKIVIMVQKEVGDRLKALPGSKDYNSLSIYISYYFSVRKLMDVSRNVFLPKPNVDSIVVELSKKANKYKVKNETLFFKLVRDAFAHKRKNLKNNLKSYNLDAIKEILNKYDYDLSVRAENLSIDIFVDIANNL